jgi:hypothetical protein
MRIVAASTVQVASAYFVKGLFMARAAGFALVGRFVGQPDVTGAARRVSLLGRHLVHIFRVALATQRQACAGKKEGVWLVTIAAGDSIVERIVSPGFLVAAGAVSGARFGVRTRMRIVTTRAGSDYAALGMVGSNFFVAVCTGRRWLSLHIVRIMTAGALSVGSCVYLAEHGLVLVARPAVDGSSSFKIMRNMTTDTVFVPSLK